MADILNLSFGCGNTLLADQLNQIVNAINQLANQNGAQRGITLNTNTRELSITNNSSTADLDSILPYGIKDGGSWDDFITFYRDNNNNYEVDINGSGGRQCDLGVTGNIRTGLTNEYSYVRTDILLLKDGRNDSYIGKLYSSNGNLYYLYVDGSGQKTKYYPELLITREKINLDGDTIGFELNVDIPLNKLLGNVSSIRIGGELDGNTLSYSNSYIAPTDGDNNPTIPQASDNNFGVIKLGYTLSGYDYPVELDSDGRAYVTVNWNSSEKELEDLMPQLAIGGSSTPIYWNGGAFDVCDMNISGITSIALGSPTTTVSVDGNGIAYIPAAGDNSYGIVKLGYTSNASYYGVLKDLYDKLYVDLSDVSLPTIGTNDSIGDVLAIIQGDNDTKKIGWAQLSPDGVAGVREIKYGYYVGNTLNYAQIATSNQTFKLIPGNNITFDTDDYHYPNSLFINASVGNVKLEDLYDVPSYDTGYLKYENNALVWTSVAPGSPTVSITDGTSSDDNQKTLSANTKYKLTVGESSYVFTTPPGGSGLTGIKYQTTGNNATTITPSSGYVTLKAGNNVSFNNSSTGILEISASRTNSGGISDVTVAGTSVVSNGTAVIPKAGSTYGVIKAVSRSGNATCETANSSSTTLNYKVLVDNNGVAFVNVPWTASGLNSNSWANYLNRQTKSSTNAGYLYYDGSDITTSNGGSSSETFFFLFISLLKNRYNSKMIITQTQNSSHTAVTSIGLITEPTFIEENVLYMLKGHFQSGGLYFVNPLFRFNRNGSDYYLLVVVDNVSSPELVYCCVDGFNDDDAVYGYGTDSRTITSSKEVVYNISRYMINLLQTKYNITVSNSNGGSTASSDYMYSYSSTIQTVTTSNVKYYIEPNAASGQHNTINVSI